MRAILNFLRAALPVGMRISTQALRDEIDSANSALRPRDHIQNTLIVAFVLREFTAIYSSAAAVGLILLVASGMQIGLLAASIAVLRLASLTFNNVQSHKVLSALREGRDCDRSLRALTIGTGLAAFTWGLFLWPLPISEANPMAVFIVILAVILAITLHSVTTAFYRPAFYSMLCGSTLSIGAKIFAIHSVVGPGLPIGALVLVAILFAYARINEAQARETIALQIKNRRMSERLKAANVRIQNALDQATWYAERDPLTGLRNRRAFLDYTERALERHRDLDNLYLCLLDIDHFKQINDRYGHQMGDSVLKAVSALLQSEEETGEVLVTGRWGGEEFIMLLTGENPLHAHTRMELVRQRIGQSHRVTRDWPEGLTVKASAGAAQINSEEGIDRALSVADAALYKAKDVGRDCLRFAA